MWVTKEKTKNGIHYRFFEQYKNPLTEKWQNTSVTFGKDNRNVRKEAQLLLNEKIERILVDLTSGETKITFKDLADRYLALAKESLALQTYQRKVAQLNKIERNLPAGIIASNITSQYLSRFFDKMLYDPQHPLQNATIDSYRATMSRVYEVGISYGYLKENPVKNAKYTKRSENQRKHDEIENKYLEDDEFKKIMLDCDQQHRQDLKRLFMWMYLTGMRLGEATTIQYKNIKYSRRTKKFYAVINGSLIVDRSIKGHPKYMKSNSAKNTNSNRTIVLSPSAVKLVEQNATGKTPEDYIFRNEWKQAKTGFFIAAKLDKVLKSIAKRQGIKNKIMESHIFRHTHVSKLAEAGVPLPIIQRRVGHGNSRVTTQIYLHVTQKMQENVSNSIENFASFLHESE